MQINRLDNSKINSKIVVTLIKKNGKKKKTQRRDIAFKLKMTDDTIYKYQAILVGLSAIKELQIFAANSSSSHVFTLSYIREHTF